MCGIVGILNFGDVTKEQEYIRRETSIFLAIELLQQTQTRGKDATGVANLFSNGDWHGLKEAIEATEFVSKWEGTDKDFGGFLKIWRNKRSFHKVFMGHCRKTSVGSTWNNANNHPIRIEDIIGIHNGTLDNHDKIFTMMKSKRDGEVDSEAIMRLVHAYSKNGTEPFTVDMIKEVAMRLQGSYAVMVMSGNNPFQVASFRDQKPIEVTLIRPTKQIIITSDNKFTKGALFRLNREIRLYDNKIYPYILDKDVDFKVMPDDGLAIWDLTREVTEDTSILDLCETGDIPRVGRLWRSVKTYTSSTTTNTNLPTPACNYHNMNARKQWGAATTPVTKTADDKKNESQTSDTESKDASSKNSGGMVWDKKLDKFKSTTEELIEADKLEHIAIDIDDGVIEQLDSPAEKTATTTKTSVKLEPGDEDTQDNVVTDPVIIEEVHVKDEVDTKDVESKTSIIDAVKVENLPKDTTHVEVETSSLYMNTEAITAANIASEKLSKFETLDDVLMATGIQDVETFKQLSPHAFSNRLQKIAYKLGFYDAWVAKPADIIRVDCVKEQDDSVKMRKFQDNFRVLKSMANVVLRVIGRVSPQPQPVIIEEEVDTALKKGEQLDLKVIDQIFSKGDFEKNSSLLTLRNIVKEKVK